MLGFRDYENFAIDFVEESVTIDNIRTLDNNSELKRNSPNPRRCETTDFLP